MTHEELRTSIDAWAIGALPEAEAREVEAHLAGCPRCQAEVQAVSGVATGLAVALPVHVPSDDVRARVMEVVGRTPHHASSAVSRERSLAARTGWLVAAASLVLCAYLTWDGLRLRDQVATLSSQLAEARALVAAAETRVASLTNAASRDRTAMAVLTAPDVATIVLAGQPEAPDSHARAFWSRQRGMVFSASKLPPAPPGKTYQVWVVTTDPAPVSAGLIEPDSQGRVEVVFATPPDIAQPKAVAVTLEPAGGVPAPTGAKYLVGLV